MNILINNKIAEFTHEDFPMLIVGAPREGSSFFSVSLMAHLFKHGEKIILFSAYEQAKELFKEQIGNSNNSKVIVVESGDDKLFIKQLENINDLSERIILYKNIDDYDVELFNKLKDLKLVIFSGDLNRCKFKNELIRKEFNTRIFFSYPDGVSIEDKIEIPKYSAHIISDKYNGIIKVDL